MFSRSDLLEIISGKRNGILASAVRLTLSFSTPIYRLAINYRNRKFDRALANKDDSIVKRAAIPVISVGNITTGGTGKTPLVIWLSRKLRNQNLRVALISRGYGPIQGRDGCEQNDEALELEHRLRDVPHLQDPDRYKMSQVAIDELKSQIVVLDDAFQHRQIHRDLDIVLIDATSPFGFNRLLPRGLLREPISSLKRADCVIVTRVDLVSAEQLADTVAKIRQQIGDRLIAATRTVASGLLQSNGHRTGLDTIGDAPTFSFCGIGNPSNFKLMLQRLEFDVCGSQIFDDHHHYTPEDLIQIGKQAVATGAKAIVCTHKDLVKVSTNEIEGLPVYAIVIDVEFVFGENEILELLNRLVVQTPSKIQSLPESS